MALAFHHLHDIKLNTQKHGAYHNLKQPCSTTSPSESYLLSQMAVIYWQDGLHISLHLPNMSYVARCWTINIISSLAKYGWIFFPPHSVVKFLSLWSVFRCLHHGTTVKINHSFTLLHYRTWVSWFFYLSATPFSFSTSQRYLGLRFYVIWCTLNFASSNHPQRRQNSVSLQEMHS